MHEVVVMNRLEQLRKRQRDEALQAQEELLAGVSRAAKHAEAAEQADVEMAAAEETVEPYDRSMSPVPFDLSALHLDERQIETIDELTDRAALVRCYPSEIIEVAPDRFWYFAVCPASVGHIISFCTPCRATR